MKNKSVVIASLVAIIVLFIGATSFYNSSKDEKLQSLSPNQAPFIRPHSMTLGDNKKQVVVVEFLDPQCEACAYYGGAVNQMYKEYYDDIKLVIRYLANHNNSKFAVKVLESARKQNLYKEVLDVVFKTQSVWGSKPKLLWEELKAVENLDLAKLKEDYENIDVDDMLSLDREDAATLQVRGTPTFFVNAKELKNLSGQGLIDLVEEELYK